MPARRSVVCDVSGVVVNFVKSDCGIVWEVARKVTFVFECRTTSRCDSVWHGEMYQKR